MDCRQLEKDRGSQRKEPQGEAVWDMQVGMLGHGRWGQKDPWNSLPFLGTTGQVGAGKMFTLLILE